MAGIDLDLVELRCKLRGWKCERDSLGGASIDPERETPAFWSRVYFDGTSQGMGQEHHEALTRPRLTLADIVASPPEGWVLDEEVDGSLDAFGFCRFEWHARYDMPDQSLSQGACVIRYEDGRTVEAIGALETQRIAAHRAVAELLVLLGEVE